MKNAATDKSHGEDNGVRDMQAKGIVAAGI